MSGLLALLFILATANGLLDLENQTMYLLRDKMAFSTTNGSDPCNWGVGLPVSSFVCLGENMYQFVASIQLTGTLPTEFGLFSGLRYLSLGFRNTFSGTIPEATFMPPTLQRLELLNLGISGTIPESFGTIQSLEHIQISGNSFITGPIPTSFANLTQLTTLYLSDNNLYGSIPTQLGLLSFVSNLDLSDNPQVNGSIPVEFYQLSFLQTLDLSKTSLSGTINSAILNMNQLNSLHLEYTSIGGSLPSELGLLPNLNDLNLTACNFYGPVPSTFSTFQGKTCDLRGNPNLVCGITPCLCDNAIPTPPPTPFPTPSRTTASPTTSAITAGSTTTDGLIFTSSDGGLSTAAIVLIAVFVSLFCIILVGVMIFVLYRRRSHYQDEYLFTNDGPRSSRSTDYADPEVLAKSKSNGKFSSIEEKSQLIEMGIEPDFILTNVKADHKLAEGAFGIVYLGAWQEFNVALKSCKDKFMWPAFLEEMKMLKSLRHPGIVQVYGLAFLPNRDLVAVMEFCERGSMGEFLRSDDGDMLSEETLVNLCISAAKSIKFLHDNKIIHRDIAARNLLITEALHVKVSDFGLSRRFEASAYYAGKESAIPIRWSAPEVILRQKFSFNSDRYAYGVLLFEIFSRGGKPFPSFTNEDIVNFISEHQFEKITLTQPKGMPDAVAELMLKLTDPEPRDRPSWEEVLSSLEIILGPDRTPRRTLTNLPPTRAHPNYKRTVSRGGSERLSRPPKTEVEKHPSSFPDQEVLGSPSHVNKKRKSSSDNSGERVKMHGAGSRRNSKSPSPSLKHVDSHGAVVTDYYAKTDLRHK